MSRRPYNPGDPLQVFTALPGLGTCLVPATVTVVDPDDDPTRPWRITYTSPHLDGPHQVLVDRRGRDRNGYVNHA
jgi:hypothetical protein